MPIAFYITGVNGIGKTTLINQLKGKLNPSRFTVYDFDERGVPDNADKEWRKSETIHWTKTAEKNASQNISTIVCGFMKFPEIHEALNLVPITAAVCLLDASAEKITERILGRYTSKESIVELERTTGKTSEKFACDNVWVSTKFREEATKNGAYIIDTSNLTPEKVAENVVSWIGLK